MFDEKVIMARLLKGDRTVDIANEMADLLNKVNKEYIEAEAKKKAAEDQKKKEFNNILEAVADWVVKWYPSMEKEVVAEALAEIDVDAMLKEIDTAYKIIDKAKVNKYTSVDEALNDFLTIKGW
jgi:uncharacterized membrane protein YheB (UPF0754 family)